MPEVKNCLACNKPMTGFRSHALTCSSTCRGIRWRANKTPLVPLKLAFRFNHFEAINEAAKASGASINNYVHGCITKDLELSQ